MAESEHIAGVSLGLDPSDFLGGSAKAQDELERLLASFIHAAREGDKTVAALAKSLSASPKEVSNALREMDKQDAEMERVAARRKRSAEQAARQQHRIEMERLKERGQAVLNLRDSLLSLAAISIGGGVGMAGAYNAIKGVAQEGASAISFARRTGTDARTNIGEEKGAELSGLSNAGEARSSIANWKRAQTLFETKGQITGPYELVRDAGLDYSQLKDMRHDEFVQAVIKGYRRLRWNDRQIASRLEESGLTSGGYTAFALDSDSYRRFNREGAEQAVNIDPQKELREAQAFARLENSVSTFRRLVADDMEPVIDSMGKMVDKLDDIAQKHPDAVKNAAIIAAGLTGIGAIIALLAPIGAVVGSLKMAATITSLRAELAALEAGAAGVAAGGSGAAGAGAGVAAASRFLPLLSFLSLSGDTEGGDDPARTEREKLVRHYWARKRPDSWNTSDFNEDEERRLMQREGSGLPDRQHIDMERLLDSVALTESGGQNGLVSRAGARGVYQLMPDTASWLGVNPDDPVQAREGARRLLEKLEQHYHGDTDKALAAYNGGQGHIDQIVSQFGNDWRAHLTSMENAQYARKVAGFYEGQPVPHREQAAPNSREEPAVRQVQPEEHGKRLQLAQEPWRTLGPETPNGQPVSWQISQKHLDTITNNNRELFESLSADSIGARERRDHGTQGNHPAPVARYEAPIVTASTANPPPLIVQVQSNGERKKHETNINMNITGVTVRTDNADDFLRSMARKAQNASNRSLQWNTGQG